MRYIARFWKNDGLNAHCVSVDATDLCEALVLALKSMLPEDRKWDMASLAQETPSVTLHRVPEDFTDTLYPHV